MEMDETAGREAFLGKKRLHAALSVLARYQDQPALFLPRLDAESTQRIEVDFHPMTPRVRRERKEVREAPLPDTGLAAEVGRHGIARAEQARKPSSARVLRQMHEEIVAART